MLKTQEPKYDAVNGRIVNRASGKAIPDDEPVFILRASDRKAAKALAYYLRQCDDSDHRSAIRQRLADFMSFDEQHPERMKEPNTASSNAN